jgi:hypothetical protein
MVPMKSYELCNFKRIAVLGKGHNTTYLYESKLKEDQYAVREIVA